MENLRGLSSFFVTRALERILPVQSLYRTLRPVVLARAAWHGVLREGAPWITPPSFFEQTGAVRSTSMDQVHCHLNYKIEMFPDRLGTSKWMSRCRIAGMEHVQQARENGRPIVLAFPHLGPYYLLGYWLRAAGLPVATIVDGKAKKRSQLNRLKERKSPFPKMPTVFHQDRLPEAIEFLRSGKPLLVAIDTPQGRQMEAPFRDGWTFQMPTGALRLAIRHGAELISCFIVEEGQWRFRIEFARPVPKEYLADEKNLIPAANYLIHELLPQFEKYPEQCRDRLFKRFKQIAPAKTIETSANELNDSCQTAAR